MKNWLTRVATVVLAATAFSSCEKDEDQITIAPSSNLTLTASGTPGVLSQTASAQTAMTYTWNPITFGMSGAGDAKAPDVRYELQVAKTEIGLSNPTLINVIDAGTSTTKNVTVEQLNAALIGLGFAPNEVATAFIRVAAIVGTDGNAFTSAPVSFRATPYKFCQQPAQSWGLVGPAGNGWPDETNVTDIVLPFDCDANMYTLRLPLKVGDFKFRANKAWTVNLGGAVKGATPEVATPLSLGGQDFSIKTAGTYTVQLKITRDAAGVATGGEVSLIP
jgi:hypothetical protein